MAGSDTALVRSCGGLGMGKSSEFMRRIARKKIPFSRKNPNPLIHGRFSFGFVNFPLAHPASTGRRSALTRRPMDSPRLGRPLVELRVPIGGVPGLLCASSLPRTIAFRTTGQEIRVSGNSESRHGMWSNRWLFVLAAAGSAVGLGNLWRFPYITGENGGGAFVLIYLICIALVGIPIMIAEVLIGREGRQSPVNSMRSLTQQHHRHRAWVLVGWMGVVAGFLILSFYAVIAG